MTTKNPTTTYWRSLEQLEDPNRVHEISEHEFAAGASEPPVLDDVSRRNFLGIVGATAALAGMTSCRKPVTHIIPFARRPEDMVPGNPLYYATAHVHDGVATGILVKSSDGRPTKVEGNPLHPSSLGGSDHLMQAELLNLYDPARSKRPVHRGEHVAAQADPERHKVDVAPHVGAHRESHPNLADFAKFWGEQKLGDGSGLRVLLEPTSSPSVAAALAELRKKYPKAGIHHWAPVNHSAAMAATTQAFGRPLQTQYDLTKADVVVSFDCDFMSQDGANVRNARDYASRRRVTKESDAGKLSRLYAVESFHSVTGSNADHRFRLRPSEIGDAVMALAGELKAKHGALISGDFARFATVADKLTYRGKKWIPILAKDLAANKGKCALVVGPRLPVQVQVVLHAINAALASVVSYTEAPAGLAEQCGKSISVLANAMDQGSVEALVVLGGNPVYSAPADIEFGKKLAKVKTMVHLSLFVDETSSHEQCTWHINGTHGLEAWGDALGHDGTATIIQPLIAPLYNGISVLEMLALLTHGMVKNGDAAEALPSGHEIVRSTWKARASGAFETWWARALHDGVIPGSQSAKASVRIDTAALESAVREHKLAAAGSRDNMEVQFRPAYNVYDGRYTNNSWLMELPDPMTKITWDNAALISLATLREAKLEQGDVVEFTVGDRKIKAPVWVLPGHADHTVTMTLGYGRSLGADFHVAQGAGYNAYSVRTIGAHDAATGVKMSGRVGRYKLALTQEHGTLEGRALVRENDVAGYQAEPNFAPEANPMAVMARIANETAAKKHDHDHDGKPDHPVPESEKVTADDLTKSLWKPNDLPPQWDYSKGNQWGMVIDLNTCIGCNACVSACVSENNIAMVGKEQIGNGREMFWNRIDRYFGSDDKSNFKHEGLSPKFNAIPAAENPMVVHQMVPCMQCENASCEVVCPVAATTHSPEGLNDMAYNRCIGTRYCGNNCPYKVRRFNYLDYHGEVAETTKMTRNPDVTIRSRGVMEKCTYCVQRINRVKIEANKDGRREIRDGEIQTACEQSCPTQAITFGNINDKDSRVAKLKASNLNYAMLAELNMRPRTTYLAKIRNPNPELVQKS